MKSKNSSIELEFRAEVEPLIYDKTLARLEKDGRTLSKTKRLSVMFLGKVGKAQLDIRVRIDNDSKAEIVFKKGNFHSHDRLEESQTISKGQILGLIKGLLLLGFSSKVTERQNSDFLLPNGVAVTLVKSKNISYVEFEKKTTKLYLKRDREIVLESMEEFGLTPLTEAHFRDICSRLSLHSDWEFCGSNKEVKKLESLLRQY